MVNLGWLEAFEKENKLTDKQIDLENLDKFPFLNVKKYAGSELDQAYEIQTWTRQCFF